MSRAQQRYQACKQGVWGPEHEQQLRYWEQNSQKFRSRGGIRSRSWSPFRLAALVIGASSSTTDKESIDNGARNRKLPSAANVFEHAHFVVVLTAATPISASSLYQCCVVCKLLGRRLKLC